MNAGPDSLLELSSMSASILLASGATALASVTTANGRDTLAEPEMIRTDLWRKLSSLQPSFVDFFMRKTCLPFSLKAVLLAG